MMMESWQILGIMAVELGMVMTPGPNMIYLVSRSISQGPRAGLISLGGVACGFLVYVVAVTAGIVALFTLVPALYIGLKLAGAAYLAWIAWKMLKPGGRSAFEPRDLDHDSSRKLFTMGFVTSVLNPKIAILFMSLLPQFVVPEHGYVAFQSLVLGLVLVAVGVTFNGLFVLTAGSISGFLKSRPAWSRAQRYVTGSVLGFFAVRMAVEPK